jgi:quinol monooxygenase YgiN
LDTAAGNETIILMGLCLLHTVYFMRCGEEGFVIIVRIVMNALPEKQKEVMQTLLSMIESTGKERGCLSYHIFRDIEDKNGFELIAEWESREDLDNYIRSARFSVLLGTKSLLREPPQIQIHTVSHSEGMETVNAARGKKSNKESTI